jgi:hypothetical protein
MLSQKEPLRHNCQGLPAPTQSTQAQYCVGDWRMWQKQECEKSWEEFSEKKGGEEESGP